MRAWAVAVAAGLSAAPLAAQQPVDFTARHRVRDADWSADGELIGYTLRSADRVRDEFRNQVFVVPRDGGPPRPIGAGRAVAFSPDGTTLARLVTVDGAAQIALRPIGGESDRVVTAVAGGVRAFRFSPSGSEIAFSADGSPAAAVARQYLARDASGRQALFVVSLASGEVRRVTDADVLLGSAWPEQPDQVPFDWLDDSTVVLSARVRGAGEPFAGATLHLVDVIHGQRRDLIGTGGRWVAPVVSPDHRWIAFSGQPVPRGPWSATELMVVRPDGSGLKRLTVGLDRDVADLGWSPDSKSIWFASEDRGVRNLHRIDVASARAQEETAGQHLLRLMSVSPRRNEVLAIRTTPTSAGALVRIAAGAPARLESVVDPDPPGDVGELEQFEVRASDGTIIDAWLHRPPGFVLGQKAPLLIDIHGGPHAMAGAGYAPWALAHAAAGALVLRVNPRGSTGYGFDLVNGLDRSWPGQDVADISQAVDDVIARGLVDTTRIAAVGTGAGAVSAVALARSDRRVRRVIARCPGSGWLSGGDGYDEPLWSEWYAARPFQMAPALWQASSPLVGLGAEAAPTLILNDSDDQPAPVDFGGALAAAIGRAGGRGRVVQLAGRCRDLGPASQAALIDLEHTWLTSDTLP